MNCTVLIIGLVAAIALVLALMFVSKQLGKAAAQKDQTKDQLKKMGQNAKTASGPNIDDPVSRL